MYHQGTRHTENKSVKDVLYLSVGPRVIPSFHPKAGKAVPLQAWSGPEGSRKLRFPDYMKTAQDGGKVVSLTHRPPLPPSKCSWYSFLLEAESSSGPYCDRKDYVNEKFQWHNLESNQRPSDL
jgi:hypothetical protein